MRRGLAHIPGLVHSRRVWDRREGKPQSERLGGIGAFGGGMEGLPRVPEIVLAEDP